MLVERVKGTTPADLEATMLGMKRAAMRRMTDPQGSLPALRLSDYDSAVARIRQLS
jgi:hypothetical protein